MRDRVLVRQGRHAGWRAWTISRGPLELILVPQVGGRIMGLRWHGHELFFTDPARHGSVEPVLDSPDVQARKRAMGFPLWGGDKTWLAPQERWIGEIPFLDLDSGPYDLSLDVDANGSITAAMTSPVDRETGIRIERILTVPTDGPEWSLEHRLTNTTSATVEWAPWDVSMLRTPGRVFLPRREDSAFPNGIKTFIREGRSAEIRDLVVKRLGGLAVVTSHDSWKFKFGVDAVEGWMLGVFDAGPDHWVGYRKRVEVVADRPYPHGCTAEVFNSDRLPYLEMEIFGPLATVEPGGWHGVQERQAVFDVARVPETEAEVRALI